MKRYNFVPIIAAEINANDIQTSKPDRKPCVSLVYTLAAASSLRSTVYEVYISSEFFFIIVVSRSRRMLSWAQRRVHDEWLWRRGNERKMRKNVWFGFLLLLHYILLSRTHVNCGCCCHFPCGCDLVYIYIFILYNIMTAWQEIIYYLTLWNWPTLGRQLSNSHKDHCDVEFFVYMFFGLWAQGLCSFRSQRKRLCCLRVCYVCMRAVNVVYDVHVCNRICIFVSCGCELTLFSAF